MATAFWIAAAVVTLVWTLLLKLSVRWVAKRADNGWDNAVGYGLATALAGLAVYWLGALGLPKVLVILLAPVVVWSVQVLSLKVIYEITALHAWVLGTVHALVSSLVVGAMTLTAGFVAAYILYGKIVSDPMWLIMLILRLIGFDVPLEAPPA